MSYITKEEKQWAESTFNKCAQKYIPVAIKNKDGIPYTTDANGNYNNKADSSIKWGTADGICWWTNGFWGGILWRIYAALGNEEMAQIARSSEVMLDRCFEEYYGLHHDVGFM